MADPRQGYTPTQLLVTGSRFMFDYTPEDAVQDYIEMHPDADEAAVRAEVQRAAA